MRRKCLVGAIVVAQALACRGAEIIAQWNFNSVMPDSSASTGTVLPSVGCGMAFLVGGTTAVFAPGSDEDPAEADNSGWNTSGYPAQGASNKTAGVQFNVSTVGYSNIAICWEQKASSSASKYCRLQYSPDGLNFYDQPDPVVSTIVSSQASVFESLSRNLESIAGAPSNPKFAFRIVTEFESTATGTGEGGYVTTLATNTYSRNGTIRFDLVTVTGTRIPGANTAPFISNIPPVSTFRDTLTPPIPVAIRDSETPAEALTLSALSGNAFLAPNGPNTFTFQGSGSNRLLRLLPAPGQVGVAPITVTVSDGTNQVSSMFPLVVVPSKEVVFNDYFDYQNGPLLRNSAYLWEHRAGIYGQCEVTNRQLQITSSQTEDVIAPLLGGPYGAHSNVVLYAGFKARFVDLPKSTPGYFAHFANGNILRGRIFASAASTLPGCFKLLISNGSEASTLLPWNFRTNTSYTLVTRYEVDSATATLWVNPSAESDASVTATDAQDAVVIAAYGFRQDAQLGSTILIDDLRVGLSFAAVSFSTFAASNRLTIEASGRSIILRWPIPGFILQSAPAAFGPFADLSQASSPYTNSLLGPAQFFRLKPD